MFDFRLKVFVTVAKRLNFTKAANELNITQPAVSKHIKEIELNLNIKLFKRNGTKIKLTKAGEILLAHTDQIFSIYDKIDVDIGDLKKLHSGNLRIGASTTIAQYVLPPILANFKKQFSDIKINLITSNSEKVEQLLIENKIDLGLIEGQIKNRVFHYFPLMKDEIVLTTRNNLLYSSINQLKLDKLKDLPLVVREPGSGTLETINLALKKHKIK